MQIVLNKKLMDFVNKFKKIHLYCADPGACANFEIIIKYLHDHGIPFQVYCDGWAAEHFSVPNIKFDEKHFQKMSASELMILGSQVDFFKTYNCLSKCKQLNIPSAFMFDHWKNYLEHFTNDFNDKLLLADTIFFPDRLCQTEFESALKQYGHSVIAYQSLLTGHVSIQNKIDNLKNMSINYLEYAKKTLQIINRPVILILLDPFDETNTFGYTLDKILNAMFRDLESFKEQYDILIKPHPRQNIEYLNDNLQKLDKSVNYRLIKDEIPLEVVIFVAEEIWGVTTVALVLAKQLGKKIRSYQPGRNVLGARQSNSYIEESVILN